MARPSRPVLLLTALVQLAAVAGLAWSATWGWPVGPLAGEPEAVTTAALLCLGLELAVVAACASAALGRLRLPRAALPVAVAGVVACSSAALALGPEHAGPAADHHGSATAVAADGPPVVDAHAPGDEHAADEHAGDGQAPSGGTAAAATGDHHAPSGATSDVAAAGTAGTDASAAAGGHGHGPVDTTPPTAEQRTAADRLLVASRASMKRYAVASVAEAEGYRVVHDADGKLLHYANPRYQADGRLLDPTRIESLLYVVLPGGGKLLVGGMYMAPKGQPGPAVGGSLTPWHAHDDLCLDPAKGIAITQLPGGGCPAGSAVGTTGEMMHVWDLEYGGGPFGELDATLLRKAVLDHFGISPAA